MLDFNLLNIKRALLEVEEKCKTHLYFFSLKTSIINLQF